MAVLALVLLFQLQIPQPVGYVNDFAGVIRPGTQARMQTLIDAVRQASRGEIVVVTLRDLGGRGPVDAGVQIGGAGGGGGRGGGDEGLLLGVELLAVEYARELGFELTGLPSRVREPPASRGESRLGGF